MTTRHTLHLTLPNGRIQILDITDTIERAYYADDGPDGTPVPASVATALAPVNPSDVPHRVVLLITDDPEAPRGGAMPVIVDNEAAVRLPAAGSKAAS